MDAWKIGKENVYAPIILVNKKIAINASVPFPIFREVENASYFYREDIALKGLTK
jgi:hypothetical protein